MKRYRNEIFSITLLILIFSVIVFMVKIILYMPIKEQSTKKVEVYQEEKQYTREELQKKQFNMDGIEVSFLEKEEMKKILSKENVTFYLTEISEKKLNERIRWISQALKKTTETYQFKEENWEDLSIHLCDCTFKSEQSDEILGYYMPYTNKILLAMPRWENGEKEFKATVNHEIAHFIYSNKLDYFFKKRYYKSYVKDRTLTMSEHLELTDFYRADKYTEETKNKRWEELIEEQIADDIKSIVSEEKNNRVIGRETTEKAMDVLKKEIMKNKEKNNTLR